MPGLLEMAAKMARDAIALDTVEFGPWDGSVRSVSADLVPRNFATTGTNFLYLPRNRSFKRRGGQTQKFDTFGSATGMLPVKWSGRGRWLDEFKSDSLCSDGIPTVSCLVTKETVASGVLDDGKFSNLWVRDQVNNLNYTLGSEYSTTTYPTVGTAQTYKVIPLWYDSGDGGITRGASEFAQRFLLSGSRRNLKVGKWIYHPSVTGTPSRGNGERAVAASTLYSRPSADRTDGNWKNNAGNNTDLYSYIDDASADTAGTDWIGEDHGSEGTTLTIDMSNPGSVSPTATHVVSVTYARGPGGSGTVADFNWRLLASPGGTIIKEVNDLAAAVGTYQTGTWTLSAAEIALISSYSTLCFEAYVQGAALDSSFRISSVEISFTLASEVANRLIPSGPFCPTHCGTIAKGTLVAGSAAVTLRPDADSVDGGWTDSAAGTNLFAQIDETTASDSDYITSAASGAFCSISLSNPGFTPGADDSVVVNFRAKRATGSSGTLAASLKEGTTTRASTAVVLTTAYQDFSFTLSSAQIASVTDWTNLFISFFVGAASDGFVSYAAVPIVPAADISAGWQGKDRFLYSVAYRFEDGSVWLPTPPRFPNDLLTTGFNLFTVDSASTDARYNKIVWSNLPVPINGVKALLLLRTPKIDSTTQDNLQLDPFDLRVTAEVTAGTTTYDDYGADDGSLGLDIGELFIRYDHIMPPRARYIFGGDMRVCHSYGGENPCAIVIAPVGRAADYDLNLADNSSTSFGSQASFMQIKLDTSSVGTLTLIQGDGETATDTKTFALSATATDTYGTLQKLVDGINATSFAVDGQQWRAQLCPGANPDATTSNLLPHNRAIASCVVDNTAKTITKAAGGLSKVAVGQLVSGAAEEAGAYVTAVVSDTSLTYTGTLTTGTETLYFYNSLGDAQITDPDTSALGFQRVISNALPGFLYFTKTYLNTQIFDKQSVWMTVASPGSIRSAANCFSGKNSNRFVPPDAGAGISMGGASCDQGFVTPYANSIYVIKNTRDSSSGVDEDYKLVAINHSRGCCAWNTVVPGNRFVPYLTPHGLFAADLDREIMLSEAIFQHAPATGDLDYEIPKCVSATAADVDYLVSSSTVTAYASARVMRSAIWLNYRDSNSTGRPDRQIVYDFSSGTTQSGLPALLKENGQPWGWSLELVRPFTAMGAGRRDDGEHLYGWNDANAGSTGDGRIDEFETGDTDNGTAISASPMLCPWEKGKDQRQISGQEIVAEHTSPAGSTTTINFYRSYSSDAYSLTPTTGSTDVVRDVKMLTQAARAQSAACRVGFGQTAGAAAEVRKLTLRAKQVRAYK